MKTKKNPNKIILTQADMKKAEARWEQEKQEIYTKSAQRASVWYQAITYLALCNVHHFSEDDLTLLQNEMNRISDKILATEGKHKNYSIDTVRKELKKYGVEFDMEEVAEMES